MCSLDIPGVTSYPEGWRLVYRKNGGKSQLECPRMLDPEERFLYYNDPIWGIWCKCVLMLPLGPVWFLARETLPRILDTLTWQRVREYGLPKGLRAMGYDVRAIVIDFPVCIIACWMGALVGIAAPLTGRAMIAGIQERMQKRPYAEKKNEYMPFACMTRKLYDSERYSELP